VSNGIEPADVEAIMIGLFNANWKLDQLVSYFFEEDDGEEEEEDSA
jgi:hypothetical protein